MSYRKIFWGIFLIFIGILFILKNTGVLFFTWHTVWHLWPVLLILWGISLIPVKDWIKVALSIATLLVAFGVMQKYGNERGRDWEINWNDNNNNDDDDDVTVTENDTIKYGATLSEKYSADIANASLTLDIGVGKFRINDSTDKLIELGKTVQGAVYSMTSVKKDSTAEIKISMKKSQLNDKDLKNNVRIKLNQNPVWDLNLNVGAADVEFDLSPFKTKNISIGGGASEIDLKLGDKLSEQNVKIEAGAASITVKVPKTVGCEIVSNTFMASKHFDGFNKTAPQHYETPDFKTNPKKIKIDIQAGVSSVDVERY